MDEIALPHKGRGDGTVPVLHVPGGTATVLEIKSNFYGALYVYGLVDTPDTLARGDMLCTVNSFSRERARAVIPRQYTHIAVDPGSRKSKPRWKAGFRSSDTCRGLKETAAGKHPDVLLYEGGGATAVFEVHGKGYARLYHRALPSRRSPARGTEGKRAELQSVGTGPFRGKVVIPGPGLIEVDCLVPWSLTLRPA
ncbi:hypothetical protein GCM10009837_68240 [Streptomyces durmitorensis]|uniref:Uncharacterized protein n=1 Tax=Streptomyces durmitorensis TaxID=319947 RepID=A0ABY4Q7F6_9ACTN|nr:hypothetical protein [Streptomyces durmitorensis]UQT61294.1 hypothetical protein M4V62_42955 [Streptomyces durmitorensis]